MRYRRYARYFNAGFPWLAEVPQGWTIKPLKYTVDFNSEVLGNDTPPEYGFRYIDISSVTSTGTIGDTESLTFEHAPSRARRKVKAGDTIISTVRTYLKAIALIPELDDQIVVSTGFAVLRPKDFDPRFLWRLVQSEPFVQTVVANSEGVSYPAISPGKLGRLPVWIPTMDEQRAIAEFLERRIAPIDSLISRQRLTEGNEIYGSLGTLLRLLENQRAALITAAVTGAIDVRADDPKR